MSGIIGIAKGVVLLCDVINTAEALNKAQENTNQPGNQLLRISNLVTQALALGFSCYETELLLTHAKATTLMTEKEWEVGSRVISMFFRVTTDVATCDGSTKGVIRAVEKGILASGVDLFRVIAESEMYYEKHFLEMSPEELAKAMRPIFASDGDGGVVIVGYRPVEIEECKANMAAFEKAAVGASFTRAAFETGVPSTIIRTGENIYQHLADFFRAHPRRPQAANVARAEAQAPQAANETGAPMQPPQAPQQQPLEEIDLLTFTAIPLPLHNDQLFSRYICPITQMPIRNPVGDPNGITLYEKSAILDWLRRRNTSPATQQPLFPNQLIPKPNIKALIDHRLRFHQQRLVAYMESPEFQLGFNVPADPNLEAAANLENPPR